MNLSKRKRNPFFAQSGKVGSSNMNLDIQKRKFLKKKDLDKISRNEQPVKSFAEPIKCRGKLTYNSNKFRKLQWNI